MEELYNWIAENMNYGVITLFMAIESSFIPFPSEIIIIPAAYIAAQTGTLNVYLVVLFGTLGALIGSQVNYWLAYWLGRPIVYRFAKSRLAHLLLINERKVVYAEEYFDKHGAISTLIGRLIPAVRQLISIPAGLAKMKMPSFVFFTLLGAGVWNSILAALGYLIPDKDLVITSVERYSGYFKIALGVLIVVGFAYWMWEVYKSGKQTKEQEQSK
jgi:membrane protein DedA with SNARE-associated domain